MKVIVTGGCGFIGSHLVKQLVDGGDEVYVIDNLSTGKVSNLQGVNIKRLFEYDLANLEIETFVKDNEELNGVGVIYHLAALPRVGRSLADPVETHHANVTGTLKALELARGLDCKRFVYASSSSVYGEQVKLPVDESADTNPMNPYACQKLLGEEYCKLYSKVFGLQCVALRFFNVYGDGMAMDGAYKLVFSNWIEQIKQGKRISIYGDGEQTRDFTYIDDIVQGLVNAKSLPKFGQINFVALNLCTGVPTSVNMLAEFMGVKDGEYMENPRPQEERFKFGSNIRARVLINWHPQIDIVEGIKRIKQYYGI